MKLLRFGPKGREKPGILDKDGVIRDLSGVIDDITPADACRRRHRQGARRRSRTTCPRFRPAPASAPASASVRNFIAIGLNYVDHAKETGSPIPKEPIIFNKAPSCIVGPNDDVVIPKGSKKTDWEVELAVIIGKRRQLHRREEGDGPCRRLCRLPRRVGARVPDRARRPVDQGQGLPDLRAARAVAGHPRRDQGRPEPRHVPRRQRQAHADRQHARR